MPQNSSVHDIVVVLYNVQGRQLTDHRLLTIILCFSFFSYTFVNVLFLWFTQVELYLFIDEGLFVDFVYFILVFNHFNFFSRGGQTSQLLTDPENRKIRHHSYWQILKTGRSDITVTDRSWKQEDQTSQLLTDPENRKIRHHIYWLICKQEDQTSHVLTDPENRKIRYHIYWQILKTGSDITVTNRSWKQEDQTSQLVWLIWKQEDQISQSLTDPENRKIRHHSY